MNSATGSVTPPAGASPRLYNHDLRPVGPDGRTWGMWNIAALWVGIATFRLFLIALLLFPAMWLGNRVGARHFGRVAPHIWQAMVAVVLGIAAVSAVVRLV